MEDGLQRPGVTVAVSTAPHDEEASNVHHDRETRTQTRRRLGPKSTASRSWPSSPTTPTNPARGMADTQSLWAVGADREAYKCPMATKSEGPAPTPGPTEPGDR